MKSLSLVLLIVACHSSPTPTPTSTTPTPPPAGNAVEAQIAQGKELYVANCMSCHGDAGQGTKDGPPVVGKDAFPLEPRAGAKRDVKFHTIA
jgi:ubiquinol-cytochrome c reductase cytochrome c subunit